MLNQISGIWGGLCARPGLTNRAAGEGGTRPPDALSRGLSAYDAHGVPEHDAARNMHHYRKAVAIRQSACVTLEQMLQTC